MKISDYFTSIERSLSQTPQISILEEPLILLASDEYNGLIRCRASFWDGSFLDIYEVVSTELGYPVRINYSYTYLSQGQVIFRYDNAPHHPEVVTHPHHKHIGPQERLAPADQPTLNQVIAEIEVIIGQKSN